MTDPVTYDRDRLRQHDHHGRRQGQRLLHPHAAALHEAFDQAERTRRSSSSRAGRAASRPGSTWRRCAGRTRTSSTLLTLGATLAERILSFPAPVVVACAGHAFPAGAFLLMAADTRVGADGPFKLGLNEVRIGLTLPWFAIALPATASRRRTSITRAVTGTMFDPQAALEAGLLDVGRPAADLDWRRPRRAAQDLDSRRPRRQRPPSSACGSGSSTSCADAIETELV